MDFLPPLPTEHFLAPWRLAGREEAARSASAQFLDAPRAECVMSPMCRVCDVLGNSAFLSSSVEQLRPMTAAWIVLGTFQASLANTS